MPDDIEREVVLAWWGGLEGTLISITDGHELVPLTPEQEAVVQRLMDGLTDRVLSGEIPVMYPEPEEYPDA